MSEPATVPAAVIDVETVRWYVDAVDRLTALIDAEFGRRWLPLELRLALEEVEDRARRLALDEPDHPPGPRQGQA